VMQVTLEFPGSLTSQIDQNQATQGSALL